MTEDNKLIAEFMGLTQTNTGLWTTGTGNDRRMVASSSEHLHYDTSWDWLMDVVEKIEGLSYIKLDKVYVRIDDKTCSIITYFDPEKLLRLTGDDKGEDFRVGISGKTKIDATYSAVVEFIKWYNQQKQ